MPEKDKKPLFPVDDPSKELSEEEAKKEMESFIKRLEDQYKGAPKELIELGGQRVVDFMKGNLSWAEMFNLPRNLINDMVEYGYLQFQSGRYEDAERFFKMLTVLDWKNAYYHSMMGSILQRQKRFGEAIAEYSEAVTLNPHDIVSLTNRGEIYMQHKKLEEALKDFEAAIALDPKKENKWANRSRLLKLQIEQIQGKKPEEKKSDKKEKGKKKK